MSPTLLVDLDDTLLDNSMDTFLPVYLQSLASELAPFVDPQRFLPVLKNATLQMVLNNRPDCTLREVFNASFFPALGINPAELQPAIDRFYQEVFPSLKAVTRPRPEAVRVIEEAFSRGYQVVIATNPLFPRQAILHRLEWAGLSIEKYPFNLVASYETFHFAKPNPAYFTELLARLGWQAGPAIVVGNDPQNDITPAQQAGLPVYQVTRQNEKLSDENAASAQGSLSGLLPWLDSLSPDALDPDFSGPAAILAVMRSTPAALDTIIRDLPTEAWTARPLPGEWALTEVLCHLRDVDAEVNLPRVKKVLQENNPFLPGKDTDPWAKERAYISQNCPQALFSFFAARLQLLDLLGTASPQDWLRTARHAIFGPTTLTEIAGIIASHDRLHIQQVFKLLEAGIRP